MSDSADKLEQLRSEMRQRNRKLLHSFRAHQAEVKAGFQAVEKSFDTIRQGMDAVRQGMDAARQGMDAVRQGFDVVLRGMDRIEGQFTDNHRQFGRIVASQDQVEARLEEHIESTDTELEALGGILRSGLGRVESTLADHEDRLNRLEESA